MSKEIELPLRARSVRPYMRIAINAMYSLNPSLAMLRARCTPMSIQVAYAQDNGTSTVIESVGSKVFELPSSCMVNQLIHHETELDKLSPKALPSSETFQGVSIE